MESQLNEIEALVALSSIPFLGPVKIKQLIRQFGSAFNALNADLKLIEETYGIGTKITAGFKHWQDNDQWKEDLSLAKKFGVKIIPYTSDKYPKNLLNTEDYPLILYVLGELKKEDDLSIAIVGTRNASIYGLEMAERISEELALKGLTIVSGLARGVDTKAHIGALKNGRTIGVIGSGLAAIYPKENMRLAEEICKNGALISELPMKTPPEKQNFPRRNRIVSGMSLGTLLIEAPVKSGAMITMEKAGEQNKKLFAIPGRIDSDTFKGNHLLIKQKLAELVESANDIYEILNINNTFNTVKPKESKEIAGLSVEEIELLERLPNEEFTIEEAMHFSKSTASRLNVLLTGLMLKKAVKEYPGKIYIKIGRN